MKTNSSIPSSAVIIDIRSAKQAVQTKQWKLSTRPAFAKAPFRNTVIAVGLVAGFGIGAANAASPDAAIPQPHSNSVGAVITDTAITAKVKTKLMSEDSLKQSDIGVSTTNGVVTLTGSATSAEAKTKAEDLAKSVDGVKSVDADVKTPTSNKTVDKTKRAVSDSWITTKVKSELLASSVSKGFKVSVTTTHGVVVLSGALANQDAIDHVKDLAEKIDGVKSVDMSAVTIAAK
ncbi:MAG: BON domain-containing protein [Pseudomonadota bacterium]